jgi:hypothetical protein
MPAGQLLAAVGRAWEMHCRTHPRLTGFSSRCALPCSCSPLSAGPPMSRLIPFGCPHASSAPLFFDAGCDGSTRKTVSPGPIPQSPIAAPCAPKAHTQSAAAGRFFRRARPRRGPGPECAAQKSDRTRPVEAAANLFQDRPLEDHVDHCIWDCLWDCERLAKLLGGFGNLETRRGRRCIAKHRARNSASHTGVRGLAARAMRAAAAEESRRAFASAWPARWRAHPKATSASLSPPARTVVSARNCVGRVLPSGPANLTMHSTTRAIRWTKF